MSKGSGDATKYAKEATDLDINGDGRQLAPETVDRTGAERETEQDAMLLLTHHGIVKVPDCH